MNAGPVYRHIEVEPLTPTIGATLHGVDLARPLSDDAFEDQVAPLTEFEDLGVSQGGRNIGQAQGHQLHLSRMNSQPSP